MMNKILWFSRHDMSQEQKQALIDKLGEIEINKVDKTINSAYEVKGEIDAADIVAIVAPINLQQQFLKLAGDKPVIMAVSERILVPQEDGTETKVVFKFVKWEQLDEITVKKHDFAM